MCFDMTELIKKSYANELSFEYLKKNISLESVENDIDDSPEIVALSDQCYWHIRVFKNGTEKIFSGSIIKQYHECMAYMDEINPRIRRPNQPGFGCKFPQNAIKESLCNAMIHRDYTDNRNIDVMISEESVVIMSPGSIWFPKDWNIKIWSEPRNRTIAKIMCILGNARMNGSGLRFIKDAYRRSGSIPGIVAKDDCFIITLPSIGNLGDSRNTMVKISGFLDINHGSTINEISDILLVSTNHAKRILQKMEEDGNVFGVGRGNSRRYFLTNGAVKQYEMERPQ